MSSIWYSVHASVHELLEEFHIFYVKVHSDVHAEVRTGNLDIIPTSCVAVFMAARRFDGFFGLLGHFSRSSGLVPELSASFSEPSMAKSSLPSRAPMPISTASVNIHFRFAQPVSKTTTTTTTATTTTTTTVRSHFGSSR